MQSDAFRSISLCSLAPYFLGWQYTWSSQQLQVPWHWDEFYSRQHSAMKPHLLHYQHCAFPLQADEALGLWNRFLSVHTKVSSSATSGTAPRFSSRPLITSSRKWPYFRIAYFRSWALAAHASQPPWPSTNSSTSTTSSSWSHRCKWAGSSLTNSIRSRFSSPQNPRSIISSSSTFLARKRPSPSNVPYCVHFGRCATRASLLIRNNKSW